MEWIEEIKVRVEVSTQGKMYQYDGNVRLDVSADWVAEFKEETDAELFIDAREDVITLLSLIDRYKTAYEEKVHYDEYRCEYLTVIDGKCLSCNRPAPQPLALEEKELK